MKTLLIANRGEIVARIARTARAMGIRCVGVHSDADRGSPATQAVDISFHLPGVAVADTYLNQTAVLEAVRRTGADAVHPGFGFLAENADFAGAVVDAGLTWVGPSPEHIAVMGDKIKARKVAEEADLPVLPAAGLDGAEVLGYPLIIKAAAGGGGKGMRVVASSDELDGAVMQATGEAERNFGDGTVYLERFLSPARHIEVQVFGDRHGNVLHLFERECSIQRRHQKIIEESPSPGVDDAMRQRLCAAALKLTRHLGYEGAGTVEFVVGEDGFYFIEMNTRLQVEHPVTEEVIGIDLVEWQLRVAASEALPRRQEEITLDGHAIEARLYAEDPAAGWAPGAGMVHRYVHGTGARYEDAITTGMVISTHYDPMIGKVISHAPSRHEAARLLALELAAIEVHGPPTNRDFLVAALRSDAFLSGATSTAFVDDHPDLRTAGLDDDVRTAHLAAALWSRMLTNRAADAHWGSAPAGWRNVRSQWSQVTFDGEEIAYSVTGAGAGPGRLDLRRGDGAVVEATITGTAPYCPDRQHLPRSEQPVTPLAVSSSSEYGPVRLRPKSLPEAPLPRPEHHQRHRPEQYIVEIDGLAYHCSVHRVGDVFWVNSRHGQGSFVEDPRFVVGDAFLAGGGPSAPMPGTVISVLVAPGDHVDEHTDLLVMEAMKMEHRIRPPGSATVAEVLVAEGDQVEAGQLLVRLVEEDG